MAAAAIITPRAAKPAARLAFLPPMGTEFAWSIVPTFLASPAGGAFVLSRLYSRSGGSDGHLQRVPAGPRRAGDLTRRVFQKAEKITKS